MNNDGSSFLLYTFALLCCCLFHSTALATTSIPVQKIQGNDVIIEQFKMGYFTDVTEKMQLNEIQKQPFRISSNSISLGTAAKVTWAKIELENLDKKIQKIYLHHPYAYHNHKVELYEVIDNTLVRERILDMDNPATLQWMYRGSAVFDIELQNKKTLYIKSISFSHQWFSLNLYNEDQSKRALLGQYTDIALLVGMILALIIYNFLLFISSRLKEHFYYSCYLVCGGFWIALSYGMFADFFNIFGSITLKWHLSLVAMPIFLILFMINIFETKSKYPIEHWALISIIVLLTINFIYGLFDIVTALKYSSSLAAVMMAVSLSVSFSMLCRKHPIALFFLIGHGLFVIFSILAVFFYKGKAEFNYINSHGVGIGIMLEALVLSLIIAYRIRILENLKIKQADLQLLASTDPLTQLFNRRHFSLAATELLNKAKQMPSPISAIIIDIDHFKRVNDTYGHVAGDKSLRCVADIIRQHCRKHDLLARYGGEEFVILMPDTRSSKAYALAEKMRQTLEHTEVSINKNLSIRLTMSIGITEVKPDNINLDEVINQADKALYIAKNNGRNQTQLSTF
ncbi:GGDEF domain-containing protein [Pseudoalteromonas sp. NGC95]|nr:GGDEF domain-containing protein [Pseudoalteromonas sp. NGC95]